MALGWHDRGSRHVFPSIARIAEITGISKLTNILGSIRRLAEAGLLAHTRVRNAKDRWNRPPTFSPGLLTVQ
ncbi:MAG: hypothetical protein JO122_08705 [Acetobacteraceae bacterium]|nr:hypothetical protein [Acetobacteraceae bacterium]